MAGPQKILVTNRAGIGDVVLSTPILKALKERYPKSHIALLVGTNVYDLLTGLDYIDEIITYERDQDSTWSIVKQIWRYDLAICIDFTYRSALMAFLAMIPVRAGLRHKRGLFLNRPVARAIEQEDMYEPYNYAGIIERSLGLTLQGDFTELDVSPATSTDLAKVDELFAASQITPETPVISIVPFSSANAKNWPLVKLQELIDRLKAAYDCRILLLGSKGDAERAAGLTGVENWLGRTKLTEMAEIFRRSRFLIGHCSGPIHIAAATKVPIVALYGATSSKHWAPKNRTILVEHPLACTPCDAIGFECSHAVYQQCMNNITVAEVFAACQKQWQASEKG